MIRRRSESHARRDRVLSVQCRSESTDAQSAAASERAGANVTWGSAKKHFTAEQLQKGINLAAEFLDNPFCEPFQKVEQKIARQQEMEVNLVKNLLHNLMQYEHALPEERESLERVAEGLVKKDKIARDASAAAVEPVKHVIKIEAI